MNCESCRHPGNQTRCPKCGTDFEEPIIEEIDGDNVNLRYKCPKCLYRYATWPKNLVIDQSSNAE